MPETNSNPRMLLRRLREFMAEAMEPQERLNRIVREIAWNMSAEVCSLYILQSDGMLELYATKGLNPNAVHVAQMRLGQGLVGTIAETARPLNLVNARDHPAFTYLPEIEEEIYSSFLGIPIFRAGRTLGVLVIQNRNQHSYKDDTVEVLETVVMLLAEMIASGNLPHLPRHNIRINMRSPVSLVGSALNEGVALGDAILHESRITVTDLFNKDIETEIFKLSAALDSLWISIDNMLARMDVLRDGEHRDVLEAYRMFAHDKGWVRQIKEAIHNGLTAEAAVEKVQSDTRSRMFRSVDPYMRERLADFDDLANRLLSQIMGYKRDVISLGKTGDNIIIARSMGAAELLDYPPEKIRGLVLEDGVATSHVVIVARAMRIPVVGQAKGIVSLLENGDPVILDGDEGRVHLRPVTNVEKAYLRKERFQAYCKKLYCDLRHLPTRTRDGMSITLLINAGLLVDLPQLMDSGAEGVGLFRTELQFMISSRFPRAQEQEQLYRAVYQQVAGKSVTFRTLDIGGDKILPYFRFKGQEENPALGWRAIRLTLDRPALLRMQLRAILKASSGRELRLMIPMVTEVDEIYHTRQLIDREMKYLIRIGHTLPMRIKLGAMIEVPGLLFQLDELMQAVDFVSVGSNDLFQFTMAVDRHDARLADRFDHLSPAFLRVLRTIVHAGERNDTPVTLCGEMAGKPIAAMALIGLGYRRLSMAPMCIGPVKSMLLSLDAGKLYKVLQNELDKFRLEHSLFSMLIDFARDNNVTL